MRLTFYVGVLAGLGVLAASPVSAQTGQYAQQVNTLLDTMESTARGSGKTRLFRSPIFYLNEGAVQDYPVSLSSGSSYFIGGVCDVDCKDLDIKLIDPSGNEVATDVLTDDSPIVNYSATRSGTYRVRVVMYDCNIAPCSAGLTIMGGNGGGGSSSSSGNQYDQQVNNQLDTMESNSSGMTRLFRSPIFKLNEGATQDYTINLVAGRSYRIGGVCDNDCPDLDIKLVDPNGKEVATDVLTDSVPIVTHTAQNSGAYRVRVVMYDCNVAPCSAGLTVMGSGGSSSASSGANQYDQQVNNQLDTMENGSSGMTRLFRSPIFKLNEGATQDYTVNLVSGRNYRIGGVCDNDCPDLDIKLLDPKGNEVATDVLTDSVPIVTHTATTTGAYRVRVVMYDCNVAPCSAGLTVMGSGASSSAAPATGQYDQQVNNQLDTFEGNNSGMIRLFRSPIFRLNEGADRDFNVTLIAGVNYKIAGVCDNDCPDLDIKLLDMNGNTVASDSLTDSLPIVNHTPSVSGGYRVRVVMYDCNTAPCSAGVTVMAPR